MSSTPIQSHEASPMKGAVARGVDHAQGSAHRAIDSAAQTVGPAIDNATAGAHRAVDSIAGATTHAAEAIGARGEQLQEVQARVSASLSRQVRDNPLAALGIALAAGYLVGWAVRQR